MSDGKKKTVFTFGKGRKRRRQQLRLARAAPRKGNGESSTASVTDSPTPGPSFVSDTSDTGPSDTPQPLASTSTRSHKATVAEPRLPVSATERKLSYQATFTDGSDVDSGSEDEEDEEQQATTSNRVITTVIARCAVLSALVKGLLCLQCGAASLVIRTRDLLGIVSVMETCCTECGAVLNSTLSSDRIEGSTSGNIAFFVTRQTVAAFMDMGVGHGGLVKFCRFLDM
ncbi:hypothetical protein LSAT2_023381 [Lamellibrachia satsuma]|nr:hypothetical protein LSAT2_023381 [Lamellibrachia satsuma]